MRRKVGKKEREHRRFRGSSLAHQSYLHLSSLSVSLSLKIQIIKKGLNPDHVFIRVVYEELVFN